MTTIIPSILSAKNSSGEKLILGIDYPHSGNLIDTNERGHPTVAIGNYQHAPQVWTVQDKSFFCWLQREDQSEQDNYIVVYDHFTKKHSDSYPLNVNVINPSYMDNHLVVSMFKIGYKIMFISERPHNGYLYPQFTGDNFDIENVSEISDDTRFGGRSAYAHIHKLGSRYVIVYRNEANDMVRLVYSDNAGTTWSSAIDIIYNENPDRKGMYPMTFRNEADDEFCVILNRRNDTSSGSNEPSFPIAYFLKIKFSENNVIVSNLSETVTKNVTAQGAVTAIEGNLYYVFKQLADPETADTGEIIRCPGGIRIEGEYYTISGRAGRTGLDFSYTDNGSVVHKEIIVDGHSLIPVINNISLSLPGNNSLCAIGKQSNFIDLFLFEQVGDYVQLCRIRTQNKGDSWTYIQQVTSGDYNHKHAQISWNYEENNKGLLIVGRQTTSEYMDILRFEI